MMPSQDGRRVTCHNVRLGLHVFSALNREHGIVVGFIDAFGTQIGDIEEWQVEPYHENGAAKRLCLVQWEKTGASFSSIGLNGVYELFIVGRRENTTQQTQQTRTNNTHTMHEETRTQHREQQPHNNRHKRTIQATPRQHRTGAYSSNEVVVSRSLRNAASYPVKKLLVEDPSKDYWMPAHDNPWCDDDMYWFQKAQREADTLLIMFSGLGLPGQKPSFIFSKFLSGIKYAHLDKLYLRDLSGCWYLNGIGIGKGTLQDTLTWLKGLTKKYQKVVAMGCSAGAFAAMLYAAIIDIGQTLAFSPLTLLTSQKETELSDYRFQNCDFSALRKLCKERDGQEFMGNDIGLKCLDLANFMPFRGSVEIHFSEHNEDRRHAERLPLTKKCRLVEHNSNTHMLALELRNKGKLHEIVQMAISN